ncbi:MAG: polyamine aminopropyltransferase 2 [Nitrospinaceae bacterium]|nr:MAG: polyamine aminopropyltransferase 2 [Nitrospinaceae bacterium]
MESTITGPSPEASRSGLSQILKICMFATGCAAMVTEYTLATLASYLLGNTILQWTMVISLMLFSMGLGSRQSRKLSGHLLDRYVLTEFGLSLFCTFSAIFSFWIAAFTIHNGFVIYGIACLIGFLTGLEIPLVTRINEKYEPLRVNISSVMEYDYYGALAGGALFAFLLLPFLGLTYTPVLLGGINLLVAGLILWKFSGLLNWANILKVLFLAMIIVVAGAAGFAKPIILYGEQHKYKDKIIYAEQTRYQKIVITQWKKDHWLFLNGSIQFSTHDEHRYHEPLVHPAISLIKERRDVLVLGGGDGLAVRELLKYPDVEQITVIDLDPAMTRLAKSHEILLAINEGALNDPRVQVINQDAYQFIQNSRDLYDAIIVDLPDPKSISLSFLYSLGFYELSRKHLKPFGVLVTQSTSPVYSPEAFLCIKKSMEAAGFSVVPYQNSIPTMGTWGWNLGVKKEAMPADRLKENLLNLEFSGLQTRFLNKDAMTSMAHFGKGLFEKSEGVEVNTQFNHIILKYYRKGDWDIY